MMVGISSSGLHILAMALMLLDHLWATVVPGNMWMTYAGRLAFPIFAFLIAEGYIHTSDVRRYAKRLLLFGLISEIPFDLMYIRAPVFLFHQNVMFTLLLGLLAIWGLDQAKKHPSRKTMAIGALALAGACLAATLGMTDYGSMGVLTIVLFWIFRNSKTGQLISLVLLNIVFFQGMSIPVCVFGRTLEFQTQGFAVLSLAPIWLYNGKKGIKSKWFRWVLYSFYPAHMLLLFMATYLL